MCPISHLHSPRFHKPPYDPGRSDFPSPVLVSALHAIYRIVVFPCRLRFKHWFAYTPRLHGSPVSSSQQATHGLTPALCLDVRGQSGTTEYPEPLCPAGVFSQTGRTSRVLSEDIALPSSLLWAHAPGQLPPLASVFPCATGLCRLSPVPAGSWPFPTLSLQSLCRCLDPYPAMSSRCACPFLPWKQRPHATGNAFGT